MNFSRDLGSHRLQKRPVSSPQLPGWIDFLRCFWSLWSLGALNWSESTLSCVTPNPFYCSGCCCCPRGSQESLRRTKNCCLQYLSGSLVSILPLCSALHTSQCGLRQTKEGEESSYKGPHKRACTFKSLEKHSYPLSTSVFL